MTNEVTICLSRHKLTCRILSVTGNLRATQKLSMHLLFNIAIANIVSVVRKLVEAMQQRWWWSYTILLITFYWYLCIQQAYSLRTLVKPTCIFRAFSTSLCLWSISPGYGKQTTFVGWNQIMMNFCVGCRHPTRHWTRSDQDLNVCLHAFTFVHLLAKLSTTGRTPNSVNNSTTFRVLMTYKRTASITRWRRFVMLFLDLRNFFYSMHDGFR